jgi:hypothetical protein
VEYTAPEFGMKASVSKSAYGAPMEPVHTVEQAARTLQMHPDTERIWLHVGHHRLADLATIRKTMLF